MTRFFLSTIKIYVKLMIESRDILKRGFTLIELLAVIVILAIIAVIATPIVLNIINETKESANLRSAEMYLEAVEQSIARVQLDGKTINSDTYNIMKNGNICLEDYRLENEKYVCEDNDRNPDNNELTIEVKGEKPSKGNITIFNGNIDGVSLELEDKTLGKSGNGGIVPVCILAKSSKEKAKELGAKYECEVRPGEKQIFYVLSINDDESINLIMDSNISKSGVAIKTKEMAETSEITVKWNESGNNIDGPITAMDYLSTATSNWTNLTEMIINEFDCGKEDFCGMKKAYKIYARLPYSRELNVVGAGCNPNKSSCEEWLIDYMGKPEIESEDGKQKNSIDGVSSYFTFSSDGTKVFRINYMGSISGDYGSDEVSGVRPVITVKL